MWVTAAQQDMCPGQVELITPEVAYTYVEAHVRIWVQLRKSSFVSHDARLERSVQVGMKQDVNIFGVFHTAQANAGPRPRMTACHCLLPNSVAAVPYARAEVFHPPRS